MKTPATIDDYIVTFPPKVRAILKKIRQVVRAAAPDAEEAISYKIAAFKNHIGVYPPVKGDAALLRAVSPYAGEKGNLRFPLDRPIPYDLIKRITKHRVKANLAKAAAKGKKGRA